MDKLFRVSSGTAHQVEVDAWFDSHPDELGHIARCWFDEMRNAGDDVLELIHDGCPVACIADAPFGYVNIFTSHVNVGFFAGAFLADPAKILQGTGKRMRHVKVSPVLSLDKNALIQLVRTAYLDMTDRLKPIH